MKEDRKVLTGMHKGVMVQINIGEDERASFSVDFDEKIVAFSGKSKQEVALLICMMDEFHNLSLREFGGDDESQD